MLPAFFVACVLPVRWYFVGIGKTMRKALLLKKGLFLYKWCWKESPPVSCLSHVEPNHNMSSFLQLLSKSILSKLAFCQNSFNLYRHHSIVLRSLQEFYWICLIQYGTLLQFMTEALGFPLVFLPLEQFLIRNENILLERKTFCYSELA